jgi:hypothetical protein
MADRKAREDKAADKAAADKRAVDKADQESAAAPDQVDSAADQGRKMPFTGDGTNTGQIDPQPGPAPEVTIPTHELHPEVPRDAGVKDVRDVDADGPAPRDDGSAKTRKP